MLFISFAIAGLDALGLEVSRAVAVFLLAVFGVLGLWIGIQDAKATPPWTADDVRDGAVGWGVIAALLLLIPCLLLPLPWSIVAAAMAFLSVVAAVAGVRRAAARHTSEIAPREPRSVAAADRQAP